MPVRGGGGGGLSINHILVPPLHPYPGIYDEGKVRSEEGIYGSAFLHCPFLPIRLEACVDPLAELTDVPMVPLLARSYPGVN